MDIAAVHALVLIFELIVKRLLGPDLSYVRTRTLGDDRIVTDTYEDKAQVRIA